MATQMADTLTTPPAPVARLLRVDIVDDGTDRYVVTPVWADVDRPISGGYSCGDNRTLAYRLQLAIEDGAVFDEVEVNTDINGNTYVSTYLNIRMRCANADLKSIGYQE